MITDLLLQIKALLDTQLSDLGYLIQATPKQRLIGNGYELTSHKGCILINAEIEEISEKSKMLESSKVAQGRCELRYRVDVSVGIRDYNDNFTLEEVLEEVINNVSYCFNDEFTALLPLAPSNVTLDGNLVQWKTASFVTTKAKIKSPLSLEIEEED